MEIVSKKILKKVYKRRPKWSHKGDFGKLLIIGGNKNYTGAPVLCGLSALSSLRSGVDWVTIAAPKRSADMAAKFTPNIITVPLKGDYLGKEHFKEISKLFKKHKCLLIGPGLGKEKGTVKTVHKIINKTDVPIVIDAEGLYALSKKLSLIRNNMILTPHGKEFEVLFGVKLSKSVKERSKIVKEKAKKYNVTILLKGHVDVISDGKKVCLNKTGNPNMTVMGTGDVLAGVVASLLAQGNNPFDSACAAAYIAGKAGDIASKNKKQGLISTDIIEKIPKVI